MKRNTPKSKRRGQTLIEMVLAISLTAVVCTVGVSTFLVGLGAWYRGESRIGVEGTAQQAVRNVASKLRTAMAVTVDANGQGLSYRLPAVDNTGTFLSPATWDGINRRIELDGSDLVIKTDSQPNQTICKKIITTDPLSSGGTTAYRVFTPGPGTITRSISLMIVTQQSAYNDKKPVYGRHRETIYLRNIPQLNQ